MYYTWLQMRSEAQRSEQPQGHLPAGDRGDMRTQLNITPCHQGSWSFGRERHVRLSSPTTLPSRDPAGTSQLAAGWRRGWRGQGGSGGSGDSGDSASVHMRGRGLTGMWPCHLLKCGQISHSIAAETPFSFHSDPHSLSITFPRLFSGAGVAADIVGGGSYGETELGIPVIWAWGNMYVAGSHLHVTSLCHVLHVQTEGWGWRAVPLGTAPEVRQWERFGFCE